MTATLSKEERRYFEETGLMPKSFKSKVKAYRKLRSDEEKRPRKS